MRFTPEVAAKVVAFSIAVVVLAGGCASSPTDATAVPSQWKEVTAGHGHSCGIAEDDSIWCWGIGYECPRLERRDALAMIGLSGGDDSELLNHQCVPQRIDSDARWTSLSGWESNCAVRDDGTLWCWDSSLRLKQVAIEDDWKMVSAGNQRCGVRENGTMWCGWGVPKRVGPQQDWAQVSASAGQQFSCAITRSGSLWCWGRLNRLAADAVPTDEPIQIESNSDWVEVDCGGRNACGIREDGSLWCWGSSDILGLRDSANLRPERIGDDDGWQSVSVGTRHACAAREDESLWCWGESIYGQLGLGDAVDRSEPVQVESRARWTAFSAGRYHSCGIDKSASLWCWGRNREKQLGGGREAPAQKVPVAGDHRFIDVSAGNNQACGVAEDGTLWCWGAIRGGSARSYPEQVGDEEDWARVIVIKNRQLGNAQGDATCGLRQDGSVSCWRLDQSEKMGRWDGGDTGWRDISFGQEHICGVQKDNTLWCWGRSREGQLGLGWEERNQRPGRPRESHRTPSQVGIDADWQMVSTHRHSSCGLRVDGTLWCWGNKVNEPQQVGRDSDWEYISHGSNDCGIRSDGTLWCWRNWKQYEPVQIGRSSDWTHVDAGSLSCGVRSPGTLWCWSSLEEASLSTHHRFGSRRDWQTIAVGRSEGNARMGVVLDQDGAAWTWGLNSQGQLGDGSWWAPFPVELGSEEGRFRPAAGTDVSRFYKGAEER